MLLVDQGDHCVGRAPSKCIVLESHMLGQEVPSELDEAKPAGVANTVFDIMPGEFRVRGAALNEFGQLVDEVRSGKVSGSSDEAKQEKHTDANAKRAEDSPQHCTPPRYPRVSREVILEKLQVVLNHVFFSKLAIHADV